MQQSKFVKDTLKNTGFIVNDQKSVWDPQTKLKWLGVVIDSVRRIIFIPEDRRDNILSSIEESLIKYPYTTARKLSKLCGKIMSTKLVLGNIVQLKTRNLYKVIEQKISWDARIVLTPQTKVYEELTFWRNNFSSLNVRKIVPIRDTRYLCDIRR